MYMYVLSRHHCLSDSSITFGEIMQRLAVNYTLRQHYDIINDLQLIQHIVYNEAAMS